MTTTRHFHNRRAGKLAFSNLPVDASERLDNRITESIEPFRNEEAIPFTPQTLSGAQANRADLDTQACQERANQRVKSTTDSMFRRTVSGYTSVVPQSSSIRIRKEQPGRSPWLMQKGKNHVCHRGRRELTCDVPWSKAKFFGRWISRSGDCGGRLLFLLFTMGVIR